MFKVCAYCQRYLGDVPPMRNFAVTHSICPTCREANRHTDQDYIIRAHEIMNFYQALRNGVFAGEDMDLALVVKKAQGLKLTRTSLLFAFIQPILYEIGERFASGEISVAIEHAFTMFCESLLNALEDRDFADPLLANVKEHERLLVCANDNYHSLGVRFLWMLLREAQCPTYMIYPGLPAKEVVTLVERVKPRILGVSVSMANQRDFLNTLSLELGRLDPIDRPKDILVGGFVFRNDEQFVLPKGMRAAPTNVHELITMMA